MTCTDVYYSNTRSSRINDIIAAAPTGCVFFIGDSIVEDGYAINYENNEKTIGGQPVVFLGSAGATWLTCRDCFPWSAIAAKNPSKIILQFSLNDVAAGCDVNGDVTSTWALVMAGAINNAKNITSNIVVMPDPCPTTDTSLSPYAVHQVARVLYYLSYMDTRLFGYSVNLAPFEFIDLYKLTATPNSYAGATGVYTGPNYAAFDDRKDGVHLTHDSTDSVWAIIMSNI